MVKHLPYNQNNLGVLSILILVFVLPFFHKYFSIALAAMFFVSLIQIIQSRKLPNIHIHWFLPLLFLYYLFSELLTGGVFQSMEKRLSLVLIPLAFALQSNFYKEHLHRNIYLSFILGNLFALLFCFGRAIIRSITLHNGAWVFNPKVIPSSEYDFLTSSIMGGNYFFGTEFSFFHHPTYASIYIVFVQFLIFEIFKSSNRRNQLWLIGCYVIFLFGLFLLSSKAAILSSIIISFWLLARLKAPKLKKISTVAAFGVVSVLFIFFNPRLKVFKDSIETSHVINPHARYGHDLRILSWDASLTLIKDNWLLGVGEANKKSSLVKIYEAKGYVVPAALVHNSHNQYLDFLIGGGLIGIGLFMAGLIVLFVQSIREPNLPLLAFLFIFSFNALFENLLSRHEGILFFSMFITIFKQSQNGQQPFT